MAAAVTRSASASPSFHHSVDPSLFPLKSIGDVVNFFRRSLEQNAEPDLTLLSIVAGYIELSFTTGDRIAQATEQALTTAHTTGTTTIASIVAGGAPAVSNADIIMGNSVPFPVVTYELVAGLYKKFQSILSVVEKPKSSHSRPANREIIKKVSDVIWHSLIRSSYKDRAHLQNLYSYLSGNKLDCFGVALAVVAGCQMLGYRDVHLAISEDHAWVVFGNKRVETIEVTWHGKGSEDKRGQDITAGIESGSWLYLGGLPVVCDRPMEVAAITLAINISLTSNSDCVEVADLQQKLLWLLYEKGHLMKYPMALGTLGELEEINPTNKSITCEQLYREAIFSAREHYRNHHVYPYTYQGNYYNRLVKYREAFAAWANAADVIRLYTYNCRDDEEIYKELLDIANEMIPYVMKTESSGHSARSILRDSEVFANLLRFYDGICQWEEDSLTPILHIGWAKPLVNNITKFDYDIRSQVVIKVPEDETASQSTSTTNKNAEVLTEEKHTNDEAKEEHNSSQNIQVEGNNNNLIKKDEKNGGGDVKKISDMSTTLANLTAACGEKILNPDFLLQGGGQPFTELKQQQQLQLQQQQQQQQQQQLQKQQEKSCDNTNGVKDSKEESGNPSGGNEVGNGQTLNVKDVKKAEVANVTSKEVLYTSTPPPVPIQSVPCIVEEEDPFEFMLKRPVITLYSQKMKGLKDLLLAEKLNTHAISLQVTAQSVASKKVRGVDKMGHHTTISTYATVNVSGGAQAHHYHHHNQGPVDGGGVAVDTSIAATRPKRTRRE